MPALAAGCLALGLAGCTFNDVPDRWTKHYRQTVDVGRAESVRAEVQMGTGQLRVEGGAGKLLDADFTYNHDDWKPEVTYDGGSFRGLLQIRQPKGTSSMGHVNYSWDLRFNDAVPLDLDINCGAGESKLDLGALDLRGLVVDMGVGQVSTDLRGRPKRDYDVKINGGIGEADVYLPNTAGIVATAHGGIGGVHVEGLHKNGDRWVNDIYDNNTAKATIHVDVSGGIGQINLYAN